MKVKIVKKLRKGKVPKTKKISKDVVKNEQNSYANKYLEFYDDIKTPSRKNDW